ncbi:MAG: ChaN family lipoprotein [Syntrophobacteraceae bacterium]
MASISRRSLAQLHLPANLPRLQLSIPLLCPICLALLLMSGCLAVSGIGPPPQVQSEPAGLHVGQVVETATGNVIGIDELAAKLSNVSVVYVGEIHTNAQDHKVQLKVLEKLSQGGRCVELGMEMFPAAAQPILDRYMRAEMTEDEFLHDVRWKEIWGFPYQLYRPLVDFQKERHMPVLGLNAPNGLVRKIAHNGLGSLTPEERSQVAREFHLDDPRNRLRVRNAYTIHGKDAIKDFESFFEAQLAWEETMAQTLAERLQKTDCKCTIVVAVGEGHIRGRLGVPYLTFIRKPHEYRTIAPVPIDYPYSTMDPDLADYVVITDKSEPLHRPTLGVTIRPVASRRGVEILEVTPGSPAAADLRKGDIILSVDGSPVKSVEEIQRLLAHGGPHYKIAVERNKKEMTITVTIEP